MRRGKICSTIRERGQISSSPRQHFAPVTLRYTNDRLARLNLVMGLLSFSETTAFASA